MGVQSCGRSEDHCCSVWSKHTNEVCSYDCKLYISPQLIGVPDLLGQCRFIKAFYLYLNKGPKALSALSSCLQGLYGSMSVKELSVCCVDKGQWCPVLGHLLCDAVWPSPMALSVSNALHK